MIFCLLDFMPVSEILLGISLEEQYELIHMLVIGICDFLRFIRSDFKEKLQFVIRIISDCLPKDEQLSTVVKNIILFFIKSTLNRDARFTFV